MTVPVFILPDIPDGWQTHFQFNPSGKLPQPLWGDREFIEDRLLMWYAQALALHQEGASWDPRHVAYAVALPPHLTDLSFDQLGYSEHLTLANFYRTWQTGAIS